MGKTSIEWTDRSTNPIRARLTFEMQPGARVVSTGHHCVKVSPGCKHCYASTLQPRFRMPGYEAVEQRREVQHFLDASKLEEVLRRRKPTKFFWCDMTDMFGDWVPNEWIAACFGVMAATPHHTHQVLTKRADRLPKFFQWVGNHCDSEHGVRPPAVLAHFARHRVEIPGSRDLGAFMSNVPWPLPNVWLGVSAEDQETADERVPHLLATPAAVRFVSAEPLLGSLDLSPCLVDDLHRIGRAPRLEIDWVIVGGESGGGARVCSVEWVASIVEQCRIAGVACFVKQLGQIVRVAEEDDGRDWGPGVCHHEDEPLFRLEHRKGGDPAEWPEYLRVRQFPEIRP